jgi:hypothetical protein
MFINSLDEKPLFTKEDGEIIKDLTQTMFEMKNKNYVSYNVYRVPREYAMRPDLISKAVYNNSQYAEIILKFNSISNPFTINEGDIILIPDLGSAKNTIRTIGAGTNADPANKIRNSYKYIDLKKVPKKSPALKAFDSRNISPDGLLPPNIAAEGDTPITYRDGRAHYNGNGNADSCLKNGMSSSEFLSIILKAKTNK